MDAITERLLSDGDIYQEFSMRHHPSPSPTFSYDGLSKLLCRSVATLRSDRVRRPLSVPPACEIPGSARPIWIYADVMEWLRAHRADQAQGQSVVANSANTK